MEPSEARGLFPVTYRLACLNHDGVAPARGPGLGLSPHFCNGAEDLGRVFDALDEAEGSRP